MGAIIMDFGKQESGVNLFRINGSKDEISKAVEDLRKLGCEIWEPYVLEKAHKQLSVLLKVQIPEIQDQELDEEVNQGN